MSPWALGRENDILLTELFIMNENNNLMQPLGGPSVSFCHRNPVKAIVFNQ